MIDSVNKHLPKTEQIPYPWNYPGKLRKVRREYQRIFPEGQLSNLLSALQALLIILMLACAMVFRASTQGG